MTSDDYEGLHRRYASLLGGMEVATLASPGDDVRRRLSSLFEGMMRSLFKEKGSEFSIDLVADPAVQEFVGAHASALDSTFQKVEMSDAMRRRLTRSNYIFSGMKAFHELHEAFPSLLDENGNRKPFERFLNDVQSIDATYNANYLRAEYNFVAASAEMAARWEQFMRDGDRYNLQYRTQQDDKVRPEHAALDRVTLPPSDPFWEEFYPPNGWNCRCSVVQVRKSKYPETSHDEAMRLGDEALQRDTKGIFRFNSGKEGKSVPDYNPYTIRRCSTCPVAKDKSELVFVPDNEVCAACKIVRALANADSKQTRQLAKPLQGSTLTHPRFKHPVLITRATISEWTNQPHGHFQEKNRALLRIKELFSKAAYLGRAGNHKGKAGVVDSHIFEAEIAGEINYIIVLEYKWGEFKLHSVTDRLNRIRGSLKKK